MSTFAEELHLELDDPERSGYPWEHLGDAERDVRRLLDDLAAAEAREKTLRDAAAKVVRAYTAEAEDWTDGEFALWQKDDLVMALVNLRAALAASEPA